MKVVIELPESDIFGAEVFGLWLKKMLDGAREDGSLDTVVGAITVGAR
jgi:hypothetical protein